MVHQDWKELKMDISLARASAGSGSSHPSGPIRSLQGRWSVRAAEPCAVVAAAAQAAAAAARRRSSSCGDGSGSCGEEQPEADGAASWCGCDRCSSSSSSCCAEDEQEGQGCACPHPPRLCRLRLEQWVVPAGVPPLLQGAFRAFMSSQVSTRSTECVFF